jgi:hypothetical protein
VSFTSLGIHFFQKKDTTEIYRPQDEHATLQVNVIVKIIYITECIPFQIPTQHKYGTLGANDTPALTKNNKKRKVFNIMVSPQG